MMVIKKGKSKLAEEELRLAATSLTLTVCLSPIPLENPDLNTHCYTTYIAWFYKLTKQISVTISVSNTAKNFSTFLNTLFVFQILIH